LWKRTAAGVYSGFIEARVQGIIFIIITTMLIPGIKLSNMTMIGGQDVETGIIRSLSGGRVIQKKPSGRRISCCDL